MNCPKCKSCQRMTTDSRPNEYHTIRQRRYKCLDCGYRWSTVEILRDDFNKLKTLSDRFKYRSDEFETLSDKLKAFSIHIKNLSDSLDNVFK